MRSELLRARKTISSLPSKICRRFESQFTVTDLPSSCDGNGPDSASPGAGDAAVMRTAQTAFETRASIFVSYSQKRRPLKTKQADEARGGTVCLRTERGDALARRMAARGASVSMLMSTNLAAPVSSGDVAGEKLIRHAPPGATRIDNRSTHPSHRTAAGTRHTAAAAGWLHAIPVRANAATLVLILLRSSRAH